MTDMNTLYCFYDMQVSPCSYDFFTFLYSAEICRLNRGHKSIKLVLVKGPNFDFREDNLRTRSQNKTFFENVILPGISLLPSCDSFMWLTREEATLDLQKEQIFPKGYSIHNPTNGYLPHNLVASKIRQDEISFFKAPQYASAIADQFVNQQIDDNAFVTLTIREIERDDFNSTRQINIDFWNNAIDRLSSLGLKTVLIRDTSMCFGEKMLEGAIEAPVASVHLPTRMALYDKAKLNLTKNNGPAILQLFGQSNCIYFNQFDENVVALSPKFYAIHYGMGLGSQFPMTATNKIVSWELDNCKTALKQIEAGLITSSQLEPNHTFHDEDNYFKTLSVGLRHLIDSLNFGTLTEDLDLYQALESYNNKKKFLDDLLEFVASQRDNSLESRAFEEFHSKLKSNNHTVE